EGEACRDPPWGGRVAGHWSSREFDLRTGRPGRNSGVSIATKKWTTFAEPIPTVRVHNRRRAGRVERVQVLPCHRPRTCTRRLHPTRPTPGRLQVVAQTGPLSGCARQARPERLPRGWPSW